MFHDFTECRYGIVLTVHEGSLLLDSHIDFNCLLDDLKASICVWGEVGSTFSGEDTHSIDTCLSEYRGFSNSKPCHYFKTVFKFIKDHLNSQMFEEVNDNVECKFMFESTGIFFQIIRE